MPELLASPADPRLAGRPPAVADPLGDELLERDVADLMTPGCLCISADATVQQAAQAIAAHRVHAVLVVGAQNGTPLGWVTTRGLLGWIGRECDAVSVTEAITEQAVAIQPHASVRSALTALSVAGTTRLLVRQRPHEAPEGVITDFDLAVTAGR